MAPVAGEREPRVSGERAQVVDLSLQAAGRVLERKVDSADDRRLVESLVGTAGGAKPGSKAGPGGRP